MKVENRCIIYYLNPAFFLFIWAWIAFIKVYLRYYKSTLLNIQDIIMEIILITILSIFVSFNDQKYEFSTSPKSNILGWISFSMIVMIIIINYWFFLIININKCLEIRKKNRKSKYEVQPKESRNQFSTALK